jgi:hypothetical protein
MVVPTAYPNLDRFDAHNQMQLDRCVQAAFGDDGIDGFEADAGRIYSSEWKRPMVCALVEEALQGGWLGRTQLELSEKLTKLKDRAWLSRGRHRGTISLDLFLRLALHPERPWNPTAIEHRLRPWMHRSASIGIARAIAARLPAEWRLAPHFLTELNYEIGCAVMEEGSHWAAALRHGNIAETIDVIQSISGPPGKDVIPFWYTQTRRLQAGREIERLVSDGNAAFARLEQLSRNWRGVFMATADLMEGILGRESALAA